jgi:hypothetical protein
MQSKARRDPDSSLRAPSRRFVAACDAAQTDWTQLRRAALVVWRLLSNRWFFSSHPRVSMGGVNIAFEREG